MRKAMSDGKTDGIALTYIKDGTMYPMGLNQDEIDLLNLTLPGIMKHKINFIIEEPICDIENIYEGRG